MAVEISEQPAREPVTVAEFKFDHIRLDSTVQEPAPTACTAALASPAVAGNVTAGTHRYKVTFVTADGQTEGSPATAAVTVADAAVNGKVSLTAISVGSGAVTARKIYRTKAGLSVYYLLTTLADNSTLVYTDNTADADLGAEIPSTNTTSDGYLLSLIRSAREYVEAFTGLSLITRECIAYLDSIPEDGIRLPYGPVQSVDLIQYKDMAGDLITWDDAEYQVDLIPRVPRIVPMFAQSWPIYGPYLNAIQITYTAGYGDSPSDCPAALRHYIKLYAAHLYENRQPVIAVQGIVVVPVPQLDNLLMPFVCRDARVAECL